VPSGAAQGVPNQPGLEEHVVRTPEGVVSGSRNFTGSFINSIWAASCAVSLVRMESTCKLETEGSQARNGSNGVSVPLAPMKYSKTNQGCGGNTDAP
jgi:hypothetical protein